MYQSLPGALDPWGVFAKTCSHRYHVEARRLARLADAVHGLTSPLEVRINGGPDAMQPGSLLLQVHLAVPIELICQRCLEPFETRLESEFCVQVRATAHSAQHGITAGDEGHRGGRDGDTGNDCEHYDSAPGQMMEILTLIEDEALLALPLVARCARPECEAQHQPANRPPGAPATASPPVPTRRPFAGLDALLDESARAGQPAQAKSQRQKLDKT